MIVHLQIIGAGCVVLALVHVIFPAYFDWKNELKPLSLINRQLMQVHTFFVALVVLLIGLLCLTSPAELTTTPLGKRLCLGLFVFWALRLFVQFFWYSPALWRGKRLETAVHVLFSLLWSYFSLVFFWVWRVG